MATARKHVQFAGHAVAAQFLPKPHTSLRWNRIITRVSEKNRGMGWSDKPNKAKLNKYQKQQPEFFLIRKI